VDPGLHSPRVAVAAPPGAERDEIVGGIPTAGAMAAFDYYNQGRLFILAGHSQGSNVLLNLLAAIATDSDVYRRMVAAYLPGYSVTREYLAHNPALKFTEGPAIRVSLSPTTPKPPASGA